MWFLFDHFPDAGKMVPVDSEERKLRPGSQQQCDADRSDNNSAMFP